MSRRVATEHLLKNHCSRMKDIKTETKIKLEYL